MGYRPGLIKHLKHIWTAESRKKVDGPYSSVIVEMSTQKCKKLPEKVEGVIEAQSPESSSEMRTTPISCEFTLAKQFKKKKRRYYTQNIGRKLIDQDIV